MIRGVHQGSSYPFSSAKNAAAKPTASGFGQRLIDAAIQADGSLNGKHVNLYMDCLVSQASGSGQELHMKYDESSTEEEPVIYAWGKDLAGKTFERKIFVNAVDPGYASPAEMKALHAHLARQGGIQDTSLPIDVAINSYDVNEKIDFTQYLKEWNAMQALAKNPTANAGRLQLEQYLSRQRQAQRPSSQSLPGENAPESLREAWDKAEQETGINGEARDADGKLSALTKLFVLSLEKFYREGDSDILGNTVSSARTAILQALSRLGSPQTDAQKKEKEFYEAFLRYL